MSAGTAKLTQKDYLKKYLSGGTDAKKKKKKKSKTAVPVVRAKVRVIDDDVDISKLQSIDESALDLYELTEDAPQVVGIVDERPAEQQAAEQYKQGQRWKVIGNDDGDVTVSVSGGPQQPHNARVLSDGEEEFSVRPMGKPSKSRDDSSPPRRRRQDHSDESPPRRRTERDESPPRRRRHDDSDASPPRKRNQSDSDASPPRKGGRNDSDASPPRQRRSGKPHRPDKKQQYDSDTSPPRKRTHNRSDASPSRKGRQQDVDESPPRRKRQNSVSPQRRKRHSDSDTSPPRKRHGAPERKQSSSARRDPNDSDASPPRRGRADKKEERGVGGQRDDKMKTTLDGKVAGLQDAKRLKQELMELKQREDKAFAKMDDSLSGRGAMVVQRDRKTGLKRDFEQEMAEQRAKDEKESKKKEKYSRWGKGLKQVDDQQEKLAQDLYEMSKPLARYADDADLDSYLREQDREGDPMLEYLRNKKKEETKSNLPVYQGSFPPNRYNIRPGYRWDGVDRSNGYESKRFAAINAKKAVEEEAYKWSTADM
ncbi:hypothetical protein ONE63_003147 [Megalurothrips usitatus]|uniref:BUD13 homolog n=1 Tax=Megalurothrips usitatus TaxID=439358 RepID=A0AAV7XA38_9NEOP|nr:hypothetical protein ONE63_003147 [Megalurothrips usitatus]